MSKDSSLCSCIFSECVSLLEYISIFIGMHALPSYDSLIYTVYNNYIYEGNEVKAELDVSYWNCNQ